MKEIETADIKVNSAAITVLLSLFAGFLTGFWAIILDPKGTGGSILMLPVILTLFPISFAMFLAGLFIGLKNSFGEYLVGASFLIPISFFISKELLLWAIN